ncbi:hypothetical protein EJB05_10185, partial [Eragrostis curvula]
MESSRTRRSRSEDDDDLLRKLPPDVLISILEKLGLRDVFRTRALSRSWRRLHDQLQLPRIVLDIYDFLPDGENWEDTYFGYDSDLSEDEDDDEAPDGDDDSDDGGRRDDCDDDELSKASHKLLDAATAVLKQQQQQRTGVPVVCTMKILLRRDYMSLGRLLDAAVAAGRVSATELAITARFLDDNPDEPLLAAYEQRFRRLFSGCPAAFGCLTRLTMERVKLDVVDLDSVLAACGRLETLSLSECGDYHGQTWHARHERLAEITVHYCGFEIVDLAWLPRLHRFTLRCWPSRFSRLKMNEWDAMRDWVLSTTPQPVSFGHVPSLTTLTLSNDDYRNGGIRRKLSSILANTAVTDLRLNFKGSNIWIVPESQKPFNDVFRNLKFLKVRSVYETCGLDWTMFLLQAAPHLKELYIKICDRIKSNDNTRVSGEVATAGVKHYNLIRFTIRGCYNIEDIIVPFTCRLVEAAVNLKEIYMRESTAFVRSGLVDPQVVTGFPRTDKEKEWLRKRITNGRCTPLTIDIIQSYTAGERSQDTAGSTRKVSAL